MCVCVCGREVEKSMDKYIIKIYKVIYVHIYIYIYIMRKSERDNYQK